MMGGRPEAGSEVPAGDPRGRGCDPAHGGPVQPGTGLSGPGQSDTGNGGARAAPGVAIVTIVTTQRMRPSGARRTRLAVLGAAVLLAGAAAAAGPRYWDWPDGRPFEEATFESAGLDTLGGLTAGPAVAGHALVGPEVAWRVASDGHDGWYAGTGHGGELHHVAADGTARLVARLESTEIFSLAVLPGGDVLAGGGPDGRLARVTSAGDVTAVGRIEGGYIWGIAIDERAGIAWLACGAPAAVYRYSWRDGALERAWELPAQNAMDVALDAGRSRLLVSTQGPGLLYSLVPGTSAPTLLGEIEQDEARRVLRGDGGAFHVLGLSGGSEVFPTGTESAGDGAMPQPSAVARGSGDEGVPAAALYRLETGPGGRESLVRAWAGRRDLMAAAWTARWGWVGAGTLPEASGTSPMGEESPSPAAEPRSTLLRLTPPWGAVPLSSWSGGDVLDLCTAAGGRELAIAVAHPAAVAVARPLAGGARGVVTGPPLDGGPGVTWARLRWEGVAGDGRPRWSVRSGDRARPDDSWSPWSEAWSDPDRALGEVAGRYLQWRVELPSAGADGRPWRVTGISVSARQPNRAPVIEAFQVEQLRGVRPGGFLGGESIIHQYRSGLRAEFTPPDAVQESWPGSERADPGRAVRVLTWSASDPNGDRLSFRLECRAEGEAAWRPAAAPGTGDQTVSGNVGSWDTSGLPDGRWELRLVASDEPDNPRREHAESTRTLGPLVVDNTPPRVDVLETATRDGGAIIVVKLRAADATSSLAAARLVFADGDTERLDPQDGVCDSGEETFVAAVERRRAAGRDPAAPVRLRVEVRDIAGNTGSVEAVVR